MSLLEKVVGKLVIHVSKQLDKHTDKKEFEAAQDALIAKDYKTALAGFEVLANRNHVRAAALAGGLYIEGKWVKANGKKALKYLQIGADGGDPDAIGLLGIAYAAGKAGIKVDYIKARPLLEAAAKLGDPQVKFMLDYVKAHQKGQR